MGKEDSSAGQWSGSGRLRGGKWGVWFCIMVLRVLGVRIARVMVAPAAVVFAFMSPDVPATMDFHRRVFGPQPRWKRRWLVVRHFNSFGRALVDRTAILAGDTKYFSFSFDGEHHLRDSVREGKGVLLLTAHIGNWEAAGALLSRLEVPVNVAGFDNESPEVRSMLNQSSKAKFKLLPLTGSPTDVLPLLAAMRRGEVVVIAGDRAYGTASANVPFLGGAAAFPVGGYLMAAIAGVPLVHVFSMSEPRGHYRLFAFPPQRPKMPAHHLRDTYLRECAERFSGDLEGILKRDPFQWYNFFPFWQQTGKEPLPRPGKPLEAVS